LTWEQKFALDVKYVDDHDLRMDAAILFRTVKVVLFREGIRHGDENEADMPEFMGTETPYEEPTRTGDKDVSGDNHP
jgi:hypothetical protein